MILNYAKHNLTIIIIEDICGVALITGLKPFGDGQFTQTNKKGICMT